MAMGNRVLLIFGKPNRWGGRFGFVTRSEALLKRRWVDLAVAAARPFADGCASFETERFSDIIMCMFA